MILRFSSVRFVLVAMTIVMPFAACKGQEKYSGYTDVTDVVAFKQHFAEIVNDIQSFKGDFTQRKEMFALTETISLKGTLWFKRDNRVRMDFITPFSYTMVINGNKMLLKDEDKETRIDASSNRLIQQINRIIVDCMQGSILESKDFSNHVFEYERVYRIELTTVSKNLKKFLSSIVLVVDKKDGTPVSIVLNEPSGDKTTMTFKNKQINSHFQDEIFSL